MHVADNACLLDVYKVNVSEGLGTHSTLIALLIQKNMQSGKFASHHSSFSSVTCHKYQ